MSRRGPCPATAHPTPVAHNDWAGQMKRNVHSDPAVSGCTPAFAGTRLRVKMLLDCVELLVARWPCLAPAHVAAARESTAKHSDIDVRNWLGILPKSAPCAATKGRS